MSGLPKTNKEGQCRFSSTAAAVLPIQTILTWQTLSQRVLLRVPGAATPFKRVPTLEGPQTGTKPWQIQMCWKKSHAIFFFGQHFTSSTENNRREFTGVYHGGYNDKRLQFLYRISFSTSVRCGSEITVHGSGVTTTNKAACVKHFAYTF